MSKFVKTIKLTSDDVDNLHNGTIKIKCGQWVKLPWSSSPSRYVGRTKGGSLWAVHTFERGSNAVMDGGMRKFNTLVANINR